MTLRRSVSLLTFLGASAMLAAVVFGQPPEQPAAAEEDLPPRTVVVDVDAPERSLYRIAVPSLLGTSDLGTSGAEVLRNDFRLVSLFDVLDARSFLANAEQEGLTITPGPWTSIGAQGVIKGEVTRTGSRIHVQMRFYEIARGTTALISRNYSGSVGELRQFMHQFANEVLELLTGRAGAFGTRIAFARRRDVGRKDVMVASFDGDSVSRVSSGNGISLLPAFGPGGVWYSVLTNERMFITHSGTQDRPIIASEGLNMGASICGGRVYFTSTRDGNSEIYSASTDGSDVRRLTDNPAIDVSPTCGGPTGQLAFVSTRHGSPQISTMSPQGGAANRVTFRGSYNQTPAWCPRADGGPLLAFTGRSGDFDVFTVNLSTGQYTRLTQGQGSNKDPAFSPDCRMVAFWSSRGGIFLSSPEGLNQNMVIPGHAETLRWSR